jgi:hypothetical protein
MTQVAEVGVGNDAIGRADPLLDTEGGRIHQIFPALARSVQVIFHLIRNPLPSDQNPLSALTDHQSGDSAFPEAKLLRKSTKGDLVSVRNGYIRIRQIPVAEGVDARAEVRRGDRCADLIQIAEAFTKLVHQVQERRLNIHFGSVFHRFVCPVAAQRNRHAG